MLQIRNIHKTFAPGTANEKKVLKGLSLHLAHGDFATIIGSNGAGKSTLFNAIAGTFLTDEGQILIDGEDMTFKPETYRAKVIGRIFQDPMKGTAPDLTIEQNLAIPYASQKKGLHPAITRRDREVFREALARLGMGLEDRMKTKMGLLSGGQRQAVTLLMAVIITPKILLLDEHTAALDPLTAEKVFKITREVVAEKGITTLMITHNIASALELGNRTLMMDDGNVVLDIQGEERKSLTVAELLQKYREVKGEMLDNDRILLS
ncbi:MAG TPA: ATP-binding cassette domain-containing protein [Candidatus Avidehalobacter gallistercoris]|uniref:ATP-binding cassette domain-containing protein n=1 Tax=Candidatus Avidehalobacter gallistercoris TaxID=2840694 RepID=A0A9D1HLB4_9FIRM|nr:ATP-binding cassette domain-containing protein [Candidatus Avidehalobacter gallistercoris]